MSRVLLLALAILAACTSRSPAAAERPNIVLILADDLGINDLHCYGRSEHSTPNLDRLAEQGMKFTTAYCAQPICSPSRAAILTGKSPARLHLTTFLPGRPNANSQKLLHPDIAQALPLEESTLPELLKPAGYTSACIGKWHLGGKGFGPTEQGFDFVFAGKPNTTPSSDEGGKGEYGLTSKAIEFIEQNRERPFFIYLAHNSPHVPLDAKPELIAKNQNTFNPMYAAMIESLDDTVGRILAKLDELKLAEKTLVVFTSDNGGLHVPELPNTPATKNTPFRAGKGFVYEGGLREPLIVRWPGKVKPGAVVEQPVSIADLAPTFLELAGAAKPNPCDFESLVPLLDGSAEAKARQFFWHFPHYANQGSRPAGAVRDGDWKLVEQYEDGSLELYNLKNDPAESQDLSAKEPGRVASMRSALERWRRDVGAQRNTPNPDFLPSAWATCYDGPNDVSKVSSASTAREGAAQLAAWRGAMDAQVNGRAAKGNNSLPAEPAQPAGFIVLNPRDAEIHGEKLRFEPQPEKDTLGFWVNADDYATWQFEVKHPGRYRVQILQGCGKGNGGSLVAIAVEPAQIEFTVRETGHFQAFVPVTAGEMDLSAGKHTLTLRPKKKAASAVMDVRQVTLTRVP